MTYEIEPGIQLNSAAVPPKNRWTTQGRYVKGGLATFATRAERDEFFEAFPALAETALVRTVGEVDPLFNGFWVKPGDAWLGPYNFGEVALDTLTAAVLRLQDYTYAMIDGSLFIRHRPEQAVTWWNGGTWNDNLTWPEDD